MKFKKIYIEITNKCNLSCSFCSKTNRKLREMSLEEFEITIKEVKKVTKYVYLHIKGEPLLHSNIEKIVRICKKNNLYVNLTTNGTLINKNKKLFLDGNNFRQVNISLHAYNDSNKINDLITLINEIRDVNKQTYFVFRYWTLNEEDENYKKLKNIMKKNYNFEDKKLNNKLSENLYFNKDYEFIWPSLDNEIYNIKGSCIGLKNHIGILSDGTVVPCCLDCEGIINLGNIFLEDINDILNKEKTKKIIEGFKKNIKTEELCRHCSFKI